MNRGRSSAFRVASQTLQHETDQLEHAPEPMPCDGCAHVITCTRRQLACRAFAQYVRSGRWKAQPTVSLPNRRSYMRLFRH
jgi:hypothetical protein